MPKKESLFNRIQFIYQNNTAIGVALLWVLITPVLGGTFLAAYLYTGPELDNTTGTFLGALGFVSLGAILMGFAIVPTTLLAIISGFLWNWKAFPFLVLAYSLASLIGYFSGTKLDKNSLPLLLENYPKAAKLIAEKKTKMGTLIFFVRISPVIPFALSNLLFALLKTGWKRVIVYGFFGMLPRTIMAFSAGLMASSIAEAFEKKGGGPQALLFIALLSLSLWGIFRFFSKSPISS